MNVHARTVRALHVIHDLRRGGAEHVLADLARVASTAGIELTVVSLRPVEDLGYAADLRAAGVTVRGLDLGGWWDPRGARRLARVVEELVPDLLHSHLKHADAIAGTVAVDAGVPHVSTLHLIEQDVGFVAARKRDVAIRSRLRTADLTIAVSDAVRSWYLEESGAEPESVITLRNGVPDPGEPNPQTVATTRDELGVADGEVLVLMVAVMRPGKGHDVLLDAVPLTGEQVRVVLAGSGPCEIRLRGRGVERVDFLGFRDDVTSLLAAADLVVHPSEADALPTALIHALAAGRPIVASAVGGIPEIVAADGGVLVPPGDPVALAGAIDRLAADPDERRWMGKRNRERYEAEFGAAEWAARLRREYDALLGR